jgi:hypothetical protein
MHDDPSGLSQAKGKETGWFALNLEGMLYCFLFGLALQARISQEGCEESSTGK